jgi:hypothetical protein
MCTEYVGHYQHKWSNQELENRLLTGKAPLAFPTQTAKSAVEFGSAGFSSTTIARRLEPAVAH